MTGGKVSFQVGGRKYTVACEAGQEDDVASLAAVIDGKLERLGGNLAPQDAQNMLMAALFLADDLREASLAAVGAAGHEARAEELSDRIVQLEMVSQASAQDIEALRKEAGEQRAPRRACGSGSKRRPLPSARRRRSQPCPGAGALCANVGRMCG